MELPVFIINGFLESGKTAFIKDTLKGEDFNDGTRSLIIACEDGEEEYSEIEMQKVNAKVVFVEDMDELQKISLSLSAMNLKQKEYLLNLTECGISEISLINYLRLCRWHR